jgi:hypothetical protein
VRRSPALALTALLLPAGLVACGDGGGGGIASGDGFSVEAALAELPRPEGGDGYTVVAFDLAAAARANGAGGAPDDPKDGGEWFIQASGAIPEDDRFPPIFLPAAQILGVDGPLSFEETRDQLGFSYLDVDAVTEVTSRSFRFGVVTGDVGEDTLGSVDLEPDEDGVATTDDELYVAADDDRLATGTDAHEVADWIDGEDEALSDEGPLAAVAAALDDDDAVSAVLTTLIPRDAGYRAVGIGWSVDDGESRQAIAYAFPDEAAAEDGAAQVEAAFEAGPGEEQLVLDEVEVDGSVVLARVRPGPEGRPQGPWIALQRGDRIFTLAEG